MKRPILLRAAPISLRERLFFHLYRTRVGSYAGLFERAELALAPGVFMRLSPSDVGHQPIALGGVYETALSERIAALALEGGLMLDVGANYGYFTCLWASAQPGNRVVAFEASPRNVEGLRHNVTANALERAVTIHAAAVGREPGAMGFQLGPEDQTGQGGFAGVAERADVQVPVHTLDELLGSDSGSAVAVLKIDVEGADTWVLEGAERLLRAHRIRHVFFEQYEARMTALGIASSRAAELLIACGYRVKHLDGDEWYGTVAD